MDVEEFDEQLNEGLTRRQVLTRIGVGAAVVWAAPVVTSFGTPAFAASAACSCAGDRCTGQTLCGNTGPYGACYCSQVHGGNGACFCGEEIACGTHTPCPNGQSDCSGGQVCLDTCCDDAECFDPCGTNPPPKRQKQHAGRLSGPS